MHAVDYDRINPSTGRPVPYFPRAEGNSIWPRDHGLPELPERPTGVGPVYDTANANSSLETFNEFEYETNYQQNKSSDETTPIPQQLTNFSEAYLAPRLTRNERLRLTMLWYLTRQVTEDKDLLRRLQEKVDIVQDFIG
ncbi:hypothetical protein H2203_005168 [Taxawa tesnikishii (nom. ined.)]|nr:hypothetical protein H2203_005168 [Dothideales sp. JES 119]